MEIATTNQIEVEAPFDYQSLEISQIDIDFLRSKEISMKARTHQVMIDNGRDLIEAKTRVGHGAFEVWCNNCLGLAPQRAWEFMQISAEFAKSPLSGDLNNLGKKSLLLICQKDTPDSAKEKIIEEAKAGKVSLKQTQEIIDREKKYEAEISDLKAENLRLKEDKKTPEPANLNNLIPDVQALLESNKIMPAMGRKLSTMTNEGQEVWFTSYVQKISLENQIKEKDSKIKELNSRPEPVAKIIEKEVIPLDVQEKLKQAETALAKLKKSEKETNDLRENFNVISEKKHKLEYDIATLKEQLKVNDPKNIDGASAESFQDILDTLENKLIRFEENIISTDYPMPKTWAVLNKAVSVLLAFSDRAEGIASINSIEV